MSERSLVLDPHRYKVTFFRLISSEFYKLTSLRSMWITQAVMILVYVGLMALIGSSQRAITQELGGDLNVGLLDAVTVGISFIAIFAIVLGIMAVTGEYSSNTMRTTVASSASRTKAFLAKILAVALFELPAALVMTAVATFTYTSTAGVSIHFSTSHYRALALFIAVLVLSAVLGVGLGYLLRKTATGVLLSVVLLFFTQFFALIRWKWVQDILVPHLPSSVMQAAVQLDGSVAISVEEPVETALTWQEGFAWVLIYVVALCVAGYAAFRARDV